MSSADGWSRSFIRLSACPSDSDPDSDIDADATAKAETNDAHPIREMDLSGRHETVDYRPNPWSIARINAASRPCLPKPTLTTTTPVRSSPRHKHKPIVEAFKRQAQRKDQPSKRDVSDPVGAPGVDKSCSANRDVASAKTEHKVCEHTVPVLDRAGPEPSNPCAITHQTQTGSTNRFENAPVHQNAAHIATFPDHAAHTRPFLFKRNFTIHSASQSSPVRPPASIGARPTPPHSSPVHPSCGLAIAHPKQLVCAAKTSDDQPPNKGATPVWLAMALEQGLGEVSPPSPPPLVSETRHDAPDPAHIRTPEPKRRRLVTPEVTPRRKLPSARGPRSPTTSALTPRYPNAYAFGKDADPDVEWSTLARTTRKTGTSIRPATKSSGIRHSGGFRLPLLGVAPSKAMRAPAETRRVITYLPPPMQSKKMVDKGVNVEPPTKCAKVDAAALDEEIEEIPVLDSDITLVNEDADDDSDKVARIDIEDVCAHYPSTRACIKAASRVREVLGCIVEVRI